jgi:hypothetical protein
VTLVNNMEKQRFFPGSPRLTTIPGYLRAAAWKKMMNDESETTGWNID